MWRDHGEPVSLNVRSSETRRRALGANRISETQHANPSFASATSVRGFLPLAVAIFRPAQCDPFRRFRSLRRFDTLSIFSAAIVAGSHRVDAGRQLIHFLGSQAADAAIRRSRMDPVKPR